MPPGTDTLVRLAHLEAELSHDIEALDRLSAELAELHTRWPPSRSEVVMAATWVHGWYTGLETGLERIARLVDETVPSGASWHAELVAQLRVEVPGVRPSVIPRSAVDDLAELRKFRHFFRNAYLVDFDPVRIEAVLARVLHCHGQVRRGLDGLLNHARAVTQALLGK